MAAPNASCNLASRSSTPKSSISRFTSQASSAEDLLRSQTVGLVHLSDFRKRRAEALEQKEREATDQSLGRFSPASKSGSITPSNRASTPQPSAKKQRKNIVKGKLSFGVEDDDDDSAKNDKLLDSKNESTDLGSTDKLALASDNTDTTVKKRLGPNSTVAMAPKVMSKSALLREAQTREQLRKEFLVLQEAVKTAEVLIPFVFYDGTNTPGGVCKVKKGDHIWVFLDRSRKVGAQLGVGGTGEKTNSRRDWARVGVDDLMLVRGEVIIPHHYDFYYFVVNKVLGPNSAPLFDYSAQPTAQPSRSNTSSPAPADRSNYDPLSRPKKASRATTPIGSHLEGAKDDPNFTKVVDRRWYERNKHIFPASVWENFDPGKDYSKGMRRDAEGNAFFFT